MHEHEKTEEGQAQIAAQKLGGGKSVKGGALVMRNIGIGIAAVVVLAILVAVGVVTFGLYKYGWEGQAARVVAGALPLPVAKVNGEAIRYSDYLADVETLERFFQGESAAGAPTDALPSPQEVRQNALDRLVFETVLRQEADLRGVTVTKDDIEAEYQTMVSQSESEEQVTAEIESVYGWTPAQFKNKVIRSYLLQQKLGAVLLQAPEFLTSAETEAADVLQQLKDGGDFAALAKEHSDDVATAPNGGDLGEFGHGIMVPEFEAAAFALKPGETSELVKTQYGYHIIRVDAVKLGDDGEVESVSARHILVMPVNVDEYFTTLVDGAEVETLITI